MISLPNRNSRASSVTSLSSSSSSSSQHSVANVLKRPETAAQNLAEEHAVLSETPLKKRWSKRRIFFTLLGASAATVVTTLTVANCLGAFDDEEGEFASSADYHFRSPSSLGVPFKEMTIPLDSKGTKLKGWLMKQPASPPAEDTPAGGDAAIAAAAVSSDKPTLIYLHGDRKDLGWSLPQMARIYNQCGFNVIGLFYRGPGGINRSQAKTLGARGDMTKAFKFISANAAANGIDPSKLFLYGEGLGSDIAAHVAVAAKQQGIQGIIMDNPREGLPMQKYRLKNWDMITRFAPDWVNDLMKHYHPTLYTNAKQISVPLCVFADERFSERVAQNVYLSSKAPNRWLVIPDTQSNYHPGLVQQQWREVLKDFVSRSLEPQADNRPNVDIFVMPSKNGDDLSSREIA
eukprot:Gregarina_sp_Pseudo_9__1388@NODE_192_length_3688_cov_29_771718_g177_i0_p2_GENE_NODE_192_length_3688_cov_29_771718_g177_i0NODE_192_length_3688_cov_29_771718_g177_i0_p2_ORF_typecomplete_len404_score119_41Abhydrolase_3/PF07859_13/7_1e10Hydrolase_4/PF12146_8/5_1e09DUF818/PF05677_12/1_9e06COesterase/PF00135_28/0_00021DUF1057/PF06342_12/0_0015Lipase/PF00151_19/0_056Chlorophyllase2/PF12740_7/9_1e02Chlorophyllase2/PF12740_7/0_65Chorion_2/PF03964_15/28Chorion_2/PF03964_15/2_5e02_NODE_192_length_3688_cov_